MSITLVCLADTHTFESDLGDIPDGDILVHAGDFCRRGDVQEVQAARDFLTGLPHAHKVIVAGNHDWLFQTQAKLAQSIFAEFIYLQDTGVKICGLHFWGSPWQPAFNDWAFNLPRGRALREKWALIPQNTDVLVTHSPPHGVLDDGSSYRGSPEPEGAAHQGCEELLQRVHEVRPALHVFGHIHTCRGEVRDQSRGIHFVNCTTWECEQPATVVTLDEVTGAIELPEP